MEQKSPSYNVNFKKKNINQLFFSIQHQPAKRGAAAVTLLPANLDTIKKQYNGELRNKSKAPVKQ